MFKPIGFALLNCVLTTILATPVLAETVLERIARTGTLTAGTRTDSIPLAYRTESGEWVGYSIDLLDIIRDRLQTELSQPIDLELVEVTVADRIAKIEDASLDIICGATTYTSRRARRVDFSVGFFRTGTQFLVKQDEALAPGQFRVGIIAGTTNAEVVEGYLRFAQFIVVPDRAAGLTSLNVGRIDALASDGILLEGLRRMTDNPDTYTVIPASPIQPEVYACILPKNNPDFRQLVNQSLLGFMQQVLDRDPQATTIVDQWFGAEGVVPIAQEPLLDFFQRTVEFYETR